MYFYAFQLCEIFAFISLRPCNSLKPAVILSKRNGVLIGENVYIDFPECSLANSTTTSNQDMDQVKKLTEQLTNLNRSMEVLTAEILKIKQDTSGIVVDQLKAKDLTIQALIEKNAIITFQLDICQRELVNSPISWSYSNESSSMFLTDYLCMYSYTSHSEIEGRRPLCFKSRSFRKIYFWGRDMHQLMDSEGA